MWRSDPLEFDVNGIPEELCTATPTLWSCMLGATTTARSEKGLLVRPKGKSALPVIAQVMAIFMKTRSQKHNTLQILNSLQLWFGGCKQEVLHYILAKWYD